jgi:hypothetical protein
MLVCKMKLEILLNMLKLIGMGIGAMKGKPISHLIQGKLGFIASR